MRTEIRYNPTSGELVYSSGKNIYVRHTKAADGAEEIVLTSDASSVIQAKGETAVGVIDSAGQFLPVAVPGM